MPFRHCGEPPQERCQVGMLAGLDQTEVTLRQRQFRRAWHGAKNRNIERRNS